MNKKLISINIAIIFIITLFADIVFANSTIDISNKYISEDYIKNPSVKIVNESEPVPDGAGQGGWDGSWVKPSTPTVEPYIKIDGKKYPSNTQSGDSSLGWIFYPGNEYAKLEILYNYSGLPIVVPQSVNIIVNHDITGDSELPAITVYGNANITTNHIVQISGQNGNPAIKVTGSLNIGEVASYGSMTYIADTKSGNTPAINANKLTIFNGLTATGPDLKSLGIANGYNSESAIKIRSTPENAVKASTGTFVPNPKEFKDKIFVAWEVNRNLKDVHPNNIANWYMANDIVDFDEDIVLIPWYINKNRASVAIKLNGNGGVTSDNSKYIITLASTSNLTPYTIPNKQFYRDDYTFNGFNTKTDGSGTAYDCGSSLSDDGKTHVYTLYAQWKKNETPSNPPSGGGGGGGGAPSESKVDISIGDTKITATLSETTVTLSKLEPSSPTKNEVSIDLSKTGKSVDTAKLSAAVIKELAKSKVMEIKLSDGNVSFNATALETISKEIGNNQLSLKAGKASEKTMNSKQKDAVKKLGNASVYEFALKAGSKTISDFNGGKAEVEINVGKGRKGQIKMHHISDKGKITDIDATYDKNTGIAKATLEHFSLYAVTFDESIVVEETPIFSDVNKDDWFYASVQYAVDNKLMNGVSETKFAPNDTLTRAMLVTVLYRNAGEPAVNKSVPFADVDMSSWYANAVIWAQQNGIVSGTSETTFAPDTNITREQIAAIMFRYAQHKGMDAVTLEENLHFADSSEISEYAISAMNWAVGTDLINGKSAITINPKDNATRAEIATILMRFLELNKD